MLTRDEFIKDLWRRAAGLEPLPVVKAGLADMAEKEWCPEFESLLRNRMIVGGYRYGRLGSKGKPSWDRVGSMLERLELYRKSGNLEHLVDVAGLCMAEFVEGEHPGRHFQAADGGTHTTERRA